MTLSTESETPASPSIWIYLGISLAFLFGGALLMPGARSLSYPSDDVLAHIALARNLAENGFIGSPGERLPVRDHGGWILLLALFGSLGVPWERTIAAATLLSAVLGIVALFRLARSSGAGMVILGWLAPAAVVTGFGLTSLLAGSSESLVLALLALGLSASIRAVRNGKLPPLGAAGWIGASACIHIEYALFWVAICVLSVFWPSDADEPTIRERLLPTLIRMVNGLIVAAILLAPFVWWNTIAVGVPIPPAPDAPMTLTSLTAGHSFGGAILTGLHEVVREFLSTVYGKYGIAGLLFGAVSALMFRSNREHIAFPVVSQLMLMTVFIGLIFCPLIYPVSGTAAMHLLKMSALLAWLFALGLFIAGAARWLSNRSAQNAGISPRTIEISAMASLGAIALLSAANGVVRTEWRPTRNSAQQQAVAREALVAQLPGKDVVQGAIATDAPGLILMHGFATVIDLTGRLHPVLLNWTSPEGVRDVEGVRNYLSHRQTDLGAFLHEETAENYRALFACPAELESPSVCRFKRGAVP